MADLTQRRTLTKYTSPDGSVEFEFSRLGFEFTTDQPARNDFSPMVDKSYSYDFRRANETLVDEAKETFKLILSDTSVFNLHASIHALRSLLRLYAKGKLWMKMDSTEYWAHARVLSGHDLHYMSHHGLYVPHNVQLIRLGDWKASSLTTGSVTLDTNPKLFTITNPGDLPIYAVRFRLRADASAGFNDPVLINETNGWQWSSTRDSASADDELKVDGIDNSVNYSTDDGSSYVGDVANFSRGADQVAFMRLEPGVNNMRFNNSGTPDSTLDYEFYAQIA